MTVERGRAWGAPGVLPGDGVVVESDAEARGVVEEARRTGEPVPVLGLLGGDLCRALGGRGDRDHLRTPDAVTFPVDLGSVLVDGRHHWFVAHLVARVSWWRGRVVAAMNAQHLGRWDLAPRAHPGDGLLDLLDADLGLSDRLEARRRLPLGTHVPHPRITERRSPAAQVAFDRPTPVWLDGERLGPATNLALRLEPDALTVVV